LTDRSGYLAPLLLGSVMGSPGRTLPVGNPPWDVFVDLLSSGSLSCTGVMAEFANALRPTGAGPVPEAVAERVLGWAVTVTLVG